MYNISWQGIVADAATKAPVVGCDLYCTSFYQRNIDESDKHQQQSITNYHGQFLLNFQKGYRLNVTLEADGYLKTHLKYPMYKLKKTDTIFITKEPVQSRIILYLLPENKMEAHTPFIREKWQQPDSIKARKTKKEWWGYDFINQKATNLIDSTDIWLEYKNKSSNNYVLKSTNQGGILPIFKSEIQTSFLLEMEKAPLEGYLDSYKPTGKEAGYFILCRNGKTFVKMIPEDYLCKVSYQTDKNVINETGIRFSYALQNDKLHPYSFPVVEINDLLNQSTATSFLDGSKEDNF
ncbi:hypothetical protein DMA11_05585 [Marinilabiliaceae bacterium JC017]|nr:hypothetical protein DMA11_05585 [Marinilabiliaceae bacterium JC017]